MLDKHLDNHSILRKHFASVLMNMVSQATITTEGKYWCQLWTDSRSHEVSVRKLEYVCLWFAVGQQNVDIMWMQSQVPQPTFFLSEMTSMRDDEEPD